MLGAQGRGSRPTTRSFPPADAAADLSRALPHAGGACVEEETRMAAQTYADTPARSDVLPAIRRISLADVRAALADGIDDFRAHPTHVMFLCLIYPVVGLVLGRAAFGSGVLPLVFPLASGFALLGPFAAVGLYELSCRRERGLPVNWRNAFGVFANPTIGAILLLALMLLAIFMLWLEAAQAIYLAAFGAWLPASPGDFINALFTTSEGWMLILVGNGIGLLFAVVVLTLSVVSFPLLIDRDPGPGTALRASVAVQTSARAVLTNPVPMLAWGLIVAVALILGSLPFLVGLAVVMPVLGHATWHLYRRVVV
jgi:uncharacterized membrane protein